MPQVNLKDPERIVLPSTKDLPEDQQAWVVMDTSPRRAGDLALVDRTMTDGQVGVAVIAGRIKEWNYTDANGKAFPITTESVGNIIGQDDFQYLATKMGSSEGGLTDEEKKDSKSTSPTNVTVNVLE